MKSESAELGLTTRAALVVDGWQWCRRSECLLAAASGTYAEDLQKLQT